MAVALHKGSCQCGAVTFEVEVDLSATKTCNCSRCQRLGAVWGYTGLDKLRIISGEEKLTTYTFNRHKGRHMFCRTCGIEPFALGSIAVVNANCLENVNPRDLPSVHVDGRAT